MAMQKQIDQVMNQLQPYISKGKELYNSFSPRERSLMAAGLAVFVLIVVLAITRPIATLFSEQALELMQAQQNVRDMAASINRYEKLLQRRAEVERAFQSVEIKEGTTSHLEGLIRNTAGIDQGGFNIKAQSPKPFGKEYQQTFYSVNFSTTDYGRLIDFLKELVDGPKPLVLKRLDIKRSRSGDKLDVDLEVGSITKER